MRAEHATVAYEFARDPNLYRYLESSPPRDESELEAEYRRLETAASPDGRERWLNWFLFDRSRSPVGSVQATVRGTDALLGYVVFTPQQGHGYAREAIADVLDFLRATGATRAMATVDERNAASLRALEALGFQIAGIQPGVSQGEPCTDIVYSRKL